MYERWAVISGIWDSVHLFPINTESMECKISHNQNIRIGLLKKNTFSSKVYLHIWVFYLSWKIRPQISFRPILPSWGVWWGLKMGIGRKRGQYRLYSKKYLYVYIYMRGSSDERKFHWWEGVGGHPDFKRVLHKDPLIFFIEFYCFECVESKNELKRGSLFSSIRSP